MEKSSNNSVTIIVPIYNTAPFIGQCLRSLFEQTMEPIEYILINDCTPDDSMEIVERVIVNYPNRKSSVRIINHTENKGLAYTRSEGLKLAKGEYIIFCDSDDWVDLDFYAQMYRVAKEEDADIVTGNYILEKKGVKYECGLPLWHDWNEFFSHPNWEFLCIWSHMIRRSFLLDFGLDFYSDIDYSEDYGLLFRCYYYSRKNAIYRGQAFYHYNKLNDDSMTANRYNKHNLRHKQKCLEYLSTFVKSKGLNPENNEILRQEKRAVKEGYLLCTPADFKAWRQAFPEITDIVIRDKGLSMFYRVFWGFGQYVHPVFFKAYYSFRK